MIENENIPIPVEYQDICPIPDKDFQTAMTILVQEPGFQKIVAMALPNYKYSELKHVLLGINSKHEFQVKVMKPFLEGLMAKTGTSCIMCHEQPSVEKLQRTGVVELDDNNMVLGMEEKPQVPKSHWAVPPFYIYLKKDLDLVRHSVENGCCQDAPGNLAHYMVEHTTMHAWPMSAGRFDIGSLDTYYEACELART